MYWSAWWYSGGDSEIPPRLVVGLQLTDLSVSTPSRWEPEKLCCLRLHSSKRGGG